MVRCEPHRCFSGRSKYIPLRWNLHADEENLGLEYMGWSFGWRYTTIDGLGSGCRAKCYE